MDTIAALFSVITAVLAVYIAYRQYQNDQYRIKIDLFDKRFEFYSKLRGVMIQCGIGINTSNKSQLCVEIGECKRLSSFLFNEEISVEVNLIYDEVMEVVSAYNRLEKENGLPLGPERELWSTKKMKLIQSIELKISDLESMFSEFMRLAK